MSFGVDLTLNDTYKMIDNAKFRGEFIESMIFNEQSVKFNGINLNIEFKSEKRYKTNGRNRISFIKYIIM